MSSWLPLSTNSVYFYPLYYTSLYSLPYYYCDCYLELTLFCLSNFLPYGTALIFPHYCSDATKKTQSWFMPYFKRLDGFQAALAKTVEFMQEELREPPHRDPMPSVPALGTSSHLAPLLDHLLSSPANSMFVPLCAAYATGYPGPPALHEDLDLDGLSGLELFSTARGKPAGGSDSLSSVSTVGVRADGGTGPQDVQGSRLSLTVYEIKSSDEGTSSATSSRQHNIRAYLYIIR